MHAWGGLAAAPLRFCERLYVGRTPSPPGTSRQGCASTGPRCAPASSHPLRRAAAAVLHLSPLFSAYLHHELPCCSSWGTSVLIGSDEPVSTWHCGGDRCHIWGRWLPVIARLPLGTPSGLRCHPRDENMITRVMSRGGTRDTGQEEQGQCRVRSAPGARSRGSVPGTDPRGSPAEGSRPARLRPVPGPCTNVPAVHPSSGPEPFLCVCAGKSGSLPSCPPAKGLFATARPFC